MTTTKRNLIVCDIDDTITKSEHQHQFAYVETLKHFGITEVNQNWVEYEHLTDSYILQQNYESNLGKPFELDFIDGFEQRMMEEISKLQPVSEIPGASAFLQHILSETDFAISFATGSFLEPAYLKLQQAEISYDPQLVIGCNRRFTREDIVLQSVETATRVYGATEFQHIISVGDGLWDYKTARNLGVHFIGMGAKNKAQFAELDVLVHLDDWRGFDLDDVLEGLGIG